MAIWMAIRTVAAADMICAAATVGTAVAASVDAPKMAAEMTPETVFLQNPILHLS